MTTTTKRFALLAAQALIVTSLGAKLLIDRAWQPRAWVKTMPVDPNAPIRGRYLSMRIEVDAALDLAGRDVSLRVQDGRLTAVRSGAPTGLRLRTDRRDPRAALQLERPLAFFLPEHAADPSRRGTGEELWMEVTVPERGAPRPIRLGIKKDGTLMPL